MDNNMNFQILDEILEPTPTGITKLLETWSYLSTNDNIFILREESHFNYLPWKHIQQVLEIALHDVNIYVRYLAAKIWTTDCDDLEYYLKNEGSPLLQSFRNEYHFSPYNILETFFDQPHEIKLIWLNIYAGLFYNTDKFTILIEQALSRNDISEDELTDYIIEYFNSNNFKKSMKLIMDSAQCDEYNVQLINHYWQLALKLNKYQSSIIVYNVPPEIGDQVVLASELFNKFSNEQINILFWRNDAFIKELRFIYFKSAISQQDEGMFSVCFQWPDSNQAISYLNVLKNENDNNKIRETFDYLYDDNMKNRLSKKGRRHQRANHLESKIDKISDDIKYANNEILILKQSISQISLSVVLIFVAIAVYLLLKVFFR